MQRRRALPRLELVSADENVVELVLAAAAASACACTITSPSEPWSVLAAPQGHAARIVDLAAMSALSPISAALRVDPDGFVLVFPADCHRSVRFNVYPRAAIAALLDDVLPELPGETPPGLQLLGDTVEAESLRDQVARAAASGDLSVMVLGEPGAGKELVARCIHEQSSAPGDFVMVRCAAIPEAAFESELFGHEAGALVGARCDRVGLLETAAQGTLFLDEIADLPLSLQARLLRLIETRSFRRVGGTADLPLEARVVSATSRMEAATRPSSRLRRELFSRLAAVKIAVPPLRDREADVEKLASAFLDAFTARHRRPPLRLGAEAVTRLRAHAWPGNVRELRALVEQIALVATRTLIEAHEVERAFLRAPSTRVSQAPPSSNRSRHADPASAAAILGKPLRDLERELIVRAFETARGNLSRAAAELGIPRTTLRDKLRRYGIVSRSSSG